MKQNDIRITAHLWQYDKRGLKAKYLSPGQTLKLPEFPEDALNIYALIEAGSKESSDSGNSANGYSAPLTEKVMSLEASSSLMFDALQVNSAGPNQSDSKDFPFNNKFARPVLPGVDPGVQDKHTKSVIDLYCNTQDWRRIDHVWLNEMGRIALEMNKLRNSNGSLLAFELGKQQRIRPRVMRLYAFIVFELSLSVVPLPGCS